MLRWTTSRLRAIPLVLLTLVGPTLPFWRANPGPFERYLGPALILMLPLLLRLVWRHVVRGGAVIALTPTAVEIDGRFWNGHHRIPWDDVAALRFDGRDGGRSAHGQPMVTVETVGGRTFATSVGLCAPPRGERLEASTLGVVGTWVRMRRESPGVTPGRLDDFVELMTRGEE